MHQLRCFLEATQTWKPRFTNFEEALCVLSSVSPAFPPPLHIYIDAPARYRPAIPRRLLKAGHRHVHTGPSRSPDTETPLQKHERSIFILRETYTNPNGYGAPLYARSSVEVSMDGIDTGIGSVPLATDVSSSLKAIHRLQSEECRWESLR